MDEVRAGVDAILVGAGTVRADDPRLQVRSAARRAARVARGEPETPLRVVLAGRRPSTPPPACSEDGGALVLQDPPDVDAVLTELAARGVRRLLVEGGTAVHTAFLAADAVDELHLAVAPLLVGDGPRFVHPAVFRPDACGWWGGHRGRHRRAALRQAGAVTERAGDRELLREAIALAARCPPSSTFRVGAVVVDAAGEVLARGWSGRRQPADHAEEAALAELVDDPRVRGGTMFSSLEPCSVRRPG